MPDSSVDSVTINVYDITGQKVAPTLNKLNNLTELEDLKNGLYIYTVNVELTDGDSSESPVMKFYVEKSE